MISDLHRELRDFAAERKSRHLAWWWPPLTAFLASYGLRTPLKATEVGWPLY